MPLPPGYPTKPPPSQRVKTPLRNPTPPGRRYKTKLQALRPTAPPRRRPIKPRRGCQPLQPPKMPRACSPMLTGRMQRVCRRRRQWRLHPRQRACRCGQVQLRLQRGRLRHLKPRRLSPRQCQRRLRQLQPCHQLAAHRSQTSAATAVCLVTIAAHGNIGWMPTVTARTRAPKF